MKLDPTLPHFAFDAALVMCPWCERPVAVAGNGRPIPHRPTTYPTVFKMRPCIGSWWRQ
jgi:hypothetical protein